MKLKTKEKRLQLCFIIQTKVKASRWIFLDPKF